MADKLREEIKKLHAYKRAPLISQQKFEWLISPTPVDEFFDTYWELKPLLIQRKNEKYFDEVTYKLENILEEAERREKKGEEDFSDIPFSYGTHINVCNCIDGVKVNLNPTSPPTSSEVKDFYEKGATLQVLQPQQHNLPLAELTSKLEEFFGCLVGGNVYLTPPNAKGLAPHHDDVEVFILQLDGRKHWKINKPKISLARECSGDFAEEEIGEVQMEFTLEKGDLLYFPRGWIHHAQTSSDNSSHLTLSTYQKNTFVDLLPILLPQLVENSFNRDEIFRFGLPVNYGSYMGSVYNSSLINQPKKEEEVRLISSFTSLVNQMIVQLSNYTGDFVNAAVDAQQVDFIQSRLPPSSSTLSSLSGQKVLTPPSSLDDQIKLINPSFIRVVVNSGEDGDDSDDDHDCDGDCDHDHGDDEEVPDLVADEDIMEDDNEEEDNGKQEKIKEAHVDVYYSLDNDPFYHMLAPSPLQIKLPISSLPVFTYLFQKYPNFVTLKELSKFMEKEMLLDTLSVLWSVAIIELKKSPKKVLKKRSAKNAISSSLAKKKKLLNKK